MKFNILLIACVALALIIIPGSMIFSQHSDSEEYCTRRITALNLANELMEEILMKDYRDIKSFPMDFTEPFNRYAAQITVDEKKKNEFVKGIKLITVKLKYPRSEKNIMEYATITIKSAVCEQ